MRRPAFAALLALAGAASAQTPRVAPQTISPPTYSAEQLRDLERLRRLAGRWADAERDRHGLLNVTCGIADAQGPRSSCGFRADGIYLSLFKPGRGPGRPDEALISFWNQLEHRGGRLAVSQGAWLQDGDLIEIATRGGVIAYLCGRLGSGPIADVTCMPFGDLAPVASRLSFPRARYAHRRTWSRDLGRAFADGSIRILHNGRPRDLAGLIGAAQDFARTDFNALAAAR